MAYLTKKTLTVLNSERLQGSVSGPHTICVTGNQRGGTSAIALFLREIGVFMGDDIDPLNQEDLKLQGARKDRQQLARIVESYDAQHETWGFKLPIGSRMLNSFLPLLRNPIVMIVTRNPVSIIRSRFARQRADVDHQEAFVDTLFDLHRDGIRVSKMVREIKTPIVFIEYERLLASPDSFGAEMLEVAGLAADQGTLEKAVCAVSTPGYQRFSGDVNKAPLEPANVSRKLFRYAANRLPRRNGVKLRRGPGRAAPGLQSSSLISCFGVSSADRTERYVLLKRL